MDREGGNKKNEERWRVNLSPFPHSLSISSFSLHFPFNKLCNPDRHYRHLFLRLTDVCKHTFTPLNPSHPPLSNSDEGLISLEVWLWLASGSGTFDDNFKRKPKH